ncbi:PREDICTED: splicing factor U2af large subunit A isoform X2 [Dinoponera quadriceps]|uniref:Splicing factor U2af large subunit A isoform X2 n=1 Tax=Dinoponera quadriceps TaxID=609295 RepID=A0A6P3XJ39_DINQU|nr:PREDICTED: splicing factor U2af large subunit A isoform X2 [Dinoponera quadriceps]
MCKQSNMDEDARTIYCGNISNKVTEDILYELFLQAGPLEKGTALYDRILTMKPRNNTEAQKIDNTMDQYMNNRMQQVQLLQQSHQIGNFSLLEMNPNNDRNLKRMDPYQRDRDKFRERDKIRDRDRNRDRDRERNRERNHNDYYRDEKPYYNRDNNHRSNDYSRYNGNRKRWTYH